MNEPREHHVTSSAVHRTALVLLVLWGASWAISYLSLGPLALPVALAIAVLKAVLVALFFMELAVERFSIRATVWVAAALIVFFVLLTALDVATRGAPLQWQRTSAVHGGYSWSEFSDVLQSLA